jgi:outer membrane PBP1 activator LpoA protein
MAMLPLRFLTLFLPVLLLVSCSIAPPSLIPKDAASLGGMDLDNDGISSPEEELIFTLLQQANNSSSPDTEFFSLQAARTYIAIGRARDAYELLTTLNTRQLELPLTTEILLLRAQYLVDNQRYEEALTILTIDRLDALPQLPINLQKQLRILRSQSYEGNNDTSAAIRERILADQVLNAIEKESNHEQLWQNLLALPVEELRDLAATEIIYAFQGWYELGIVGKAYQYNLDRQLVELNNWQLRWPRHPAAEQLPKTLQLVEQMAAERPDQIALLLPLNTAAGLTVRDSFLSAYLNVLSFGGKVPQVRFYDTSTTNDMIALHRQAQLEGAGMVIGPLLRQNVAQLQSVRNLGVPTLALNNIEGLQALSPQLYQFALSPESETRQLAIKAWNDGHRYAAILSPLNPVDEIYQRKLDSFIQQWTQLGGQVVTQEFFSNNYTQSIENLLDLNASENRKEEISDLINVSLEFSQRRRQDVDFIFLIADPLAARQIKPSLGYLYAGDLPVYATQDIYSGIHRPLEDIDLNGIIFGESPWLLSEEDELKASIQFLFPQNSAQNLRLQAFGIDAFRLYPRIRQMETGATNAFVGATGELTLDTENRITRKLTWARIQDGFARPLNAKN